MIKDFKAYYKYCLLATLMTQTNQTNN